MKGEKYDALKAECDAALRAIPTHGLEKHYPDGIEVWSYPYDGVSANKEAVFYDVFVARPKSPEQTLILEHFASVAQATKFLTAIFEGLRGVK